MKYSVLYDCQIEKTHRKKGEVIEFKEGTDTGFIKRLISSRVIEPMKDAKEQADKAKEAKEKKNA